MFKNVFKLVLLISCISVGLAQPITSNNGVTVVGALPTGANVIGAVTQSGTWNVTVNQPIATGSNTIGAVTQASGPWSQNVTQLGGNAIAVNAGASSTGTQRVSANIALTGTEVGAGQATMANSIPVVIASNQSAITTTTTVNDSTCTGTQRSQAWAAVPTSATSVTTTTACVDAITFTNTNSSTQTVTVVDGQGSPITMVATYVVPGNSTVVFPFHRAPSTTGFKWSAGGTGVTGSAHWQE